VNGHPLAEPLDEEAAFQFMYDLVRGRLTTPDIATGLREFAV
jgi:death-on-curing protein